MEEELTEDIAEGVKSDGTNNAAGSVSQPGEEEPWQEGAEAQWVPLSKEVPEGKERGAEYRGPSQGDAKNTGFWGPALFESGLEVSTVEGLFRERHAEEMGEGHDDKPAYSLAPRSPAHRQPGRELVMGEEGGPLGEPPLNNPVSGVGHKEVMSKGKGDEGYQTTKANQSDIFPQALGVEAEEGVIKAQGIHPPDGEKEL